MFLNKKQQNICFSTECCYMDHVTTFCNMDKKHKPLYLQMTFTSPAVCCHTGTRFLSHATITLSNVLSGPARLI